MALLPFLRLYLLNVPQSPPTFPPCPHVRQTHPINVCPQVVKRMPSLDKLLLDQGDMSSWPHVHVMVDLIRGLLQYDPAKRTTAQQALDHPFFALSVAPVAATEQALSTSLPPCVPPEGGSSSGQDATTTAHISIPAAYYEAALGCAAQLE